MKLNKEYRVLKGILYKEGIIPVMLLDVNSKREWDDEKTKSSTKKDEEERDRNRAKSTPSGIRDVPSGDSKEATLVKGLPVADEASRESSGSHRQSKSGSQPAIKKGFLVGGTKGGDTKKSTAGASPDRPPIGSLPSLTNSDNPSSLREESQLNICAGTVPRRPNVLTGKPLISEVPRSSKDANRPVPVPTPTSASASALAKPIDKPSAANSIASDANANSNSNPDGNTVDEKIPKYSLIERGQMSMGTRLTYHILSTSSVSVFY